jgi:hypothetical protein
MAKYTLEDKKQSVLRGIATGTPIAKALLIACDTMEEEEELRADKDFVREMDKAQAKYAEGLRANINFCMDRNIHDGCSTEARYLHDFATKGTDGEEQRPPEIHEHREFEIAKTDDNIEMNG